MAKIFLASDHAGFALKEKVKAFLIKKYEVFDLSPSLVEGDDYPDHAFPAAKRVAKDKGLGVFICGNGIGMCICANKVKGVRATVVYDDRTAMESRAHNDANIICLGGRTIKEKDAIRLVMIFLTTRFEGARHERRVKKIGGFESFRL